MDLACSLQCLFVDVNCSIQMLTDVVDIFNHTGFNTRSPTPNKADMQQQPEQQHVSKQALVSDTNLK